MAESYIDQMKRNTANGNTEYEDVLIAGEITHVKCMIKDAIKKNKNSIAWTYVYDSYDSCISQIDDLYGVYQAAKYFDTPSDVGILSYGGLGYYLARWKDGTNACPPSPPEKLDFEYITRNLKEELYKLGCKTVRLDIGPKTVNSKKQVKKGSFFKNAVYEDVTNTIVQWMISISW